MGRCRIVTLPDGTRVRANTGGGVSDADLIALQEVIDEVREQWAGECHTLSPFPMPEVSQRAFERETYWCHLERGHDGSHRWHDYEWEV